jgi:hypothetical protein
MESEQGEGEQLSTAGTDAKLKRNALMILRLLDRRKPKNVSDDDIKEEVKITFEEVNKAVEYLAGSNAVRRGNYASFGPQCEFNFDYLQLTEQGADLFRNLSREITLPDVPIPASRRSTSLIQLGLPFALTEEDLEHAARQKRNTGALHVVVGLQWKSRFYKTGLLCERLKDRFRRAVDRHNAVKPGAMLSLKFDKLSAGLGKHVFSRIARDIVGSDIAIFEASDRNPNVMIELGVALVCGIRVILMLEAKAKKIPSDIEGLTWIKYRDSGKETHDDELERKLRELIEECATAKRKMRPASNRGGKQ